MATSNYKEIRPEEFDKSTFQLMGKDWMLITAEKDKKINTMTAAWGGFGVMFGRNVAYIVVRPQRFTKQFVDSADKFSLTFFEKDHKKMLNYMGTTSGRDEDKISKANLTTKYIDGTPYFDEASIVVVCRKMYAQDFKDECFIDREIEAKVYPTKDYHTFYIAEIEKILVK